MLIVIGPSQEAFPDSFLTFSPIYLYYLLYPYNPSRSMSLTSRLPSALKEIRLHLCQSSPRSAGAREFLTANYANIKKSNPELPLLIREAQGVRAMAWARFGEYFEVRFRMWYSHLQEGERIRRVNE